MGAGAGLETVHVDRGFAFGVLPRVVVVVWRLRVTPERFATSTSAFTRAVARAGETFGFLSIVERTSPPPSPGVVAGIDAFMSRLPRLGPSVSVLEGRPPWIARSIDASLGIAAKLSWRARTKVCVDEREAVSWLVRQREPDLGEPYRPRLLAAIRELRALMPPA